MLNRCSDAVRSPDRIIDSPGAILVSSSAPAIGRAASVLRRRIAAIRGVRMPQMYGGRALVDLANAARRDDALHRSHHGSDRSAAQSRSMAMRAGRTHCGPLRVTHEEGGLMSSG